MDYHTFFSVNAQQFLEVRGLSFHDLSVVINKQYEETHVALITSSAVHGVANAASDIDLICVTPRQQDQAMASQIYHGDHHMEVVAFSREDIDHALWQLAEDAEMSVVERLRAFKRWDRTHSVPRKYLERIVSGVSTDQTLPYLEAQRALSSTWSTAAFDDFRQSACFAVLAWRSNECRAASAYTCNALLFLMNAILSKHGWVNSNKKWTLLRWDMASRALKVLPSDDLTSRIDELWSRAYPACRSGLQSGEVSRLCELVDLAESEFACRADYLALRPVVSDAAVIPFLPGAEFVLISGDQAALLPKSELPQALSTQPFELSESTPQIAKYLLRGARTGLVGFSLTDQVSQQGVSL